MPAERLPPVRALLPAATLLFWQMVSSNGAGDGAEPWHLRYLRPVELPARASGQVCAELDADALAHAASRFGNDLRLFSGKDGAVEVPFALTESEAQPVNAENATVQNLIARGNDVVFDLRMPDRPYTDVVLNLDAKNFMGTATVTGAKTTGVLPEDLGTFTIFDLSAKRLARSTTLSLQETSYPVLHVVLRLHSQAGPSSAAFAPGIVKGAEVPPSRENQTIYTTVAQTEKIEQRGNRSVAVLRIASHVPVERVTFALRPGFAGDFLRPVEIIARPDAAADSAATESIAANISDVKLPGASAEAGADSAETPAESRRLNVDAALGANLRGDATVEVAVQNGADPPLPIRSVGLAMRQRMICFDAFSREAPYTLRYGDAGLPAPVYDYAQSFQPAAEPIEGKLGPERRNPHWEPRADERPYTERHPELLWVGLLMAVAVFGGTAMQGVKKRGKRS